MALTKESRFRSLATALFGLAIAGCGVANNTASRVPVLAPGQLGGPFVSGNVGWVEEGQGRGPIAVFRTTDGGLHWQRQRNLPGPGPARLSADGEEALLMSWIPGAVSLYHTTNGGADWQQLAVPEEVDRATATPTDTGGAWEYFLNPHEGWILTDPQATGGFGSLFHTMDSGGHWSLVARLDANKVFGSRGAGGLVFRDSSTGWTGDGAATYMTQDGGLTWHRQIIAPPPGVGLDSSYGYIVSLPFFINAREGFLSLAPSPKTEEATYLYGTADGGLHWSFQAKLPIPKVFPGFGPTSFIDSSNWVLFDGTRLIRTSDAGSHWSALPGSLPSDGLPSALKFDDPMNGWMVLLSNALRSSIYRTTDGGSHWTPITVPSAS